MIDLIELLERADPAQGVEIDAARLRRKVDERLGLVVPSEPVAAPRRLWLLGVAAFAVVIVAFVPLLLRSRSSVYDPRLDALREVPGIDAVVRLASGGVQTMAVDGDTIWVMTALQNRLQRVSVRGGEVVDIYAIDAYVEGVIVGGGYVWLLSYDDGGEVLRFDPTVGAVDLTIPIGGWPGGAAWFDGSLWVSNDRGELHQISAAGLIVSTSAGELKGQGLGYLWVNDPTTGLISSLTAGGARGDIVIPTHTGLVTADGWGVRHVAAAGGYLWLMDDDYPFGTNLSVFDPTTGELSSFASLTFGLIDMVEFDGLLWVTSHTDHLLFRIDPESGEMHRYPVPGKAGGLLVAGGSLWMTLYHPGALVRLDPSEGLIEAAPIVADDWNRYPHRLLCTGSAGSAGPTVILEPFDWIDYGSWSVVQAQLSEAGLLVCANGYVKGEASPQQRAADLSEALTEAAIPGPYLLVAAGDGVHATRLFADGRGDIAGVVLVEPMPIGFQRFYDHESGGGGHPPWADLERPVGDFGNLPLVVIGHDPDAVFLSRRFIEFVGRESAEAIDGYWQEGLAFYAGLSTNSRSTVAAGTGLDMVVWDRPDLIVAEVLDLAGEPR